MFQAADLIAWARAHTWGEYLAAREGEDAPYTTDSPDAHIGKGHDLVVLPGGVDAHGVVFTSERLIAGNLIPAIEEGGVKGIAGKTDGTYKISYEGGWELFSIGTHAVGPRASTADC